MNGCKGDCKNLFGNNGVPWFDLTFYYNIVLYCIIGGGRLDFKGDYGHKNFIEGLFNEGVNSWGLLTWGVLEPSA